MRSADLRWWLTVASRPSPRDLLKNKLHPDLFRRALRLLFASHGAQNAHSEGIIEAHKTRPDCARIDANRWDIPSDRASRAAGQPAGLFPWLLVPYCLSRERDSNRLV